MNRVSNAQFGDVDNDLSRHRARQSNHEDLVQRMLDHAAVELDAVGLADQMHWHGGGNLLGHRDGNQVDVRDTIADTVDLHRLENRVDGLVLTIDHEREDRVATGLAHHRGAQLDALDLEWHRLAALTVQHTRNHVLLAQTLVLARRCGLALGDGECGVRHVSFAPVRCAAQCTRGWRAVRHPRS